MSFGIYEILLKSKKVRVFSNEVILKAHKNISNIKPLKLKSTATVEYIAYYNNKTRQVDIHKIKDKYRKTNITLSNFEEINKDKITSSLDYLNQKEKKKKVQLPELDKVQNNLDYTEELLDFQKELINNEVISRNPYNYQALMGLKNPAKDTEKKGSDKEGNILKRVLNYYLYELGLTPLKEIENYTPEQVFYLSTKGDFEIGLQLKKLSPIEASYFEQNQVMRDAMITLGFREVIGCNIHLVGSLFEALYYIACIQGNCDISNRIFKALTRTDEPMKLIHVPK
mgnify:FL=1